MGRVVLLSGGLDSTVCLAMSSADACLFVDYGQPALEQERAAAAGSAERYGVPLYEVQIPMALGEMAAPAGDAGPRIVPGRNLAMISAAVSLAAKVGADAVVFGASKGDRLSYPDCRPEFIFSLSLACVSAYGVAVEAPLERMTRSEVVDLAYQHGISAEHVWSCYTPIDGKPCGTCDSCKQQAVA